MGVIDLKWIQLAQTVLVFILPALVVALIAGIIKKTSPWAWLRLDGGVNWRQALPWMLIVVIASPAVNLLSSLNQAVHLPECLSELETAMRQQEDMAAEITMMFLMPRHWYDLILNLGLMAILPGLAEELTFRGLMVRSSKHWNIWLVAVLFSAIHMQWFGFVPRMLLGALFGYVFVWTGNLWIPILMHITNNTMAVVCYDVAFRMGMSVDEVSGMESIGAGSTWYIGLASLLITLYAIQRCHRSIGR